MTDVLLRAEPTAGLHRGGVIPRFEPPSRRAKAGSASGPAVLANQLGALLAGLLLQNRFPSVLPGRFPVFFELGLQAQSLRARKQQ